MKSKYWGIWLLLVVALVFFVVISFIGDDVFSTGPFKKAPFHEHLLKTRNNSQDSLLLLSEQLPEDVSEKIVEIDSLPQSIFIFGDSMTLNLAYRLAQYARQNGHTINSVNWDSSNTITWAQSDTLDYFIKKFKPTFIFIALGSNELYLKKPETRIPYVKKILEKIDTIPYIWLGPPNWKEDAGINDMLAKECRPGSFFLTNGMKLDRKKDKVHPTRQASALWVDSVVRWLPNSSHPIVMDIPADSIGKQNPHVVFLKALNK